MSFCFENKVTKKGKNKVISVTVPEELTLGMYIKSREQIKLNLPKKHFKFLDKHFKKEFIKALASGESYNLSQEEKAPAQENSELKYDYKDSSKSGKEFHEIMKEFLNEIEKSKKE
jgi:hypothetical protein